MAVTSDLTCTGLASITDVEGVQSGSEREHDLAYWENGPTQGPQFNQPEGIP
jgi:hypothetical protein